MIPLKDWYRMRGRFALPPPPDARLFSDFLNGFSKEIHVFFHDFGRGGFVKPRKRGPLVINRGHTGGGRETP